MTIDRIKEIQAETAYPNSTSVQQALLKVWNECQQEQGQVKNCSIPDVVGQSEQFVCVCYKTGYYIEDGVRICDNCNAPHYTN